MMLGLALILLQFWPFWRRSEPFGLVHQDLELEFGLGKAVKPQRRPIGAGWRRES